jgi:hypothetical protein
MIGSGPRPEKKFKEKIERSWQIIRSERHGACSAAGTAVQGRDFCLRTLEEISERGPDPIISETFQFESSKSPLTTVRRHGSPTGKITDVERSSNQRNRKRRSARSRPPVPRRHPPPTPTTPDSNQPSTPTFHGQLLRRKIPPPWPIQTKRRKSK